MDYDTVASMGRYPDEYRIECFLIYFCFVSVGTGEVVGLNWALDGDRH